MGFFVQSPNPHRHPKKIRAMSPNFLVSPVLIKFELTAPVSLLLPGRLLFLKEDKIFYNQHIHLGPHETPVGVFWSADDGLASDVETCINYNSAAGQFLELRNDGVVVGFMVLVHGLESGRIIQMGYGRYVAPFYFETIQHGHLVS